MTPEQLYFYLKGFIELGNGGATTPGPEIWANIVQNVKAVKVTKCGCKPEPTTFGVIQPPNPYLPHPHEAAVVKPISRPPDTIVNM